MRTLILWGGFLVAGLAMPLFVLGCAQKTFADCSSSHSCPAEAGADATDEEVVFVGPPDSVAIAMPESGADAAADTALEPNVGAEQAASPEAGGCAGGSLLCNGACVPSDPHNCGTCGHDCTSLLNVAGTVMCLGGVCTFDTSACKAGFAHCAGSPDLGCETNLATQSNCGACGNACVQSTPICAASAASYGCVSGCQAPTPTACGSACVNTADDAQNCGACGKVCTTGVAHATPTCSGGTCGYQCDASDPNACGGGCVDFNTDGSNCGSCGKACTGGTTCQGGGCACSGGTHDCSGTCVSNTSTASCGTTSCTACTVPANGISTCNGTACGVACNSGYSPCGNTCVDETLNGNCGGCGNTCAVSCTNSQCLRATAVVAGAEHTCALLSNGTVECWGGNEYGQLGYTTTQMCGTTACSLSPHVVPGLTGVASISSSNLHTCVVLTSGAVNCWGWNANGQIGLPSGGASASPVAVSGITSAVAVVAGYESTCALISGGTVECWGDNNVGQLGTGSLTLTQSSSPVQVTGLSNATAIALGQLHACALRSDQTVVCWGDDGNDELGSTPMSCDANNDSCSPSPVPATGVAGVTALASGNLLTCVLAAGNVTQCWGYSQAGLGDQAATTTSYMPITVATSDSPAGLAVGDAGACLLLSGGAAACWGLGPLGSVSTPTPVANLTNATALAVGNTHACALLSGGTASCWGDNSYGQLGNGTGNASSTPTPVVW
jgi:alpha-tubulin suppressor-like RCC1 family protein